jgi:hypothetical protein
MICGLLLLLLVAIGVIIKESAFRSVSPDSPGAAAEKAGDGERKLLVEHAPE